MKYIVLFVILLSSIHSISQTIPSARRTDWSSPGYQGSIPTPTLWKDIMTFGGNKTGASDNTAAFNSAVASLSGAAGVVYLPAGSYLFNSTLSVPANVIVKGASSDSTSLNFNLGGATANSINITGSASTTPIVVTAGSVKGSTSLTLTSTSGINLGDYIEFRVDGAGFMLAGSFGMDDLAQICKVTAVSGSTITIAKPLRWNFNLSTNPRVYTMTPIQKVGLECFKITRLDTSSNQSTMINFEYAANCWVKGVESVKTTFAHIAFSKSIHCELTESYIHHAWAYSDGGRAYGVCVQRSSSECLVQNNIFEHLRHSFLFQTGANGNVTAYNFSTDPYWTQGLFPTNSTGEITMHGNFPFMNLFEGNICDNIVIDNSHGNNGPFNTFFRNRGSRYGIFMNAGAGDSSNFVNNEVPSSAPFFTNSFALTGNGNYSYGNNKGGTATPSGTSTPPDWASYYLASTPAWFTSGALPRVGYANAFNSGTIPAKARFLAGVLNRCSCPVRSACTFNSTVTLKITQLCCSYDLKEVVLTPTSGSATFNFYSDGVTYRHGSLNPLKLTFMPPYNRTVTIQGTDMNGCTNTQSILLP
jgi:hypothetical protein